MKPTMKWGARILAVALSASMALPVFADQATHSHPQGVNAGQAASSLQIGSQVQLAEGGKHLDLHALADSNSGESGEWSTPYRDFHETPPAGKPATAPFDKPIADGLTFFENASQAVSQQNPDYQSDAKPVFDSEGNVTGISVNGQVQDYSTQIPYWCNEGVYGSTDGEHHVAQTNNVCYRNTNLFEGLTTGAATGQELSVIDGKPHVIIDDENIDPKLIPFLKRGILQQAMADWNVLLGKDFYLFKSQTTTDPSERGKLLVDPSRDRIQYLSLYYMVSDDFWAAAGQAAIFIDGSDYDKDADQLRGFLKESPEAGYYGWQYHRSPENDFHYRANLVTWGTQACPSDPSATVNTHCVHFANGNDVTDSDIVHLLSYEWRAVLDHELGHIVGLGHPNNEKKDTYTVGAGVSGCAADESYYDYGPLLMQYNSDNSGAMLDGTFDTSVEYRMVKDAVSAGLNYLKAAKSTTVATPAVHRSIETALVDNQENKLEQKAPRESSEQTVYYTATYSDIPGASYCGGFESQSYNTFNPTSDMPQVKVGVKGYEVSLDGGKTWAEDATVPAVKLSPTDAFRFDYTAQGIVYKSHDGKDVLTDLGVKDLPAVQVLYRVAASKPDNPSNPGNEPAQPGKDQPAQPGKDKPAQLGKTVQPSKATSKKPVVVAASRLGDTGADASMIALAALLLVAAGCSLTFLSRIHTHE